MAGTTTYYGISYPTSTDYVKDGATAMQTIATGFDSAVAIPTYNNQTGTSYTFVLADAGKVVTSNNAAAVTFTIPPQASVAWANNTTLTVRNLGAGVVTIAGGSGVTVTNTAQTVAQYGEVKLIRTASNAWTVVPASGGTSGLTLVGSSSFTTQTSVSLNNVFSSTYQNYRILLNVGAKSTETYVSMRLRASGTDTTANYNWSHFYVRTNTATATGGAANTGEIQLAYSKDSPCNTSIDIYSPNEAAHTNMNFGAWGIDGTSWYAIFGGANQTGTTQFDGFTMYVATGTMTGTIRVFGYQNS